MPIHLSVQANTVNYAGVKFWQSLGLTRVILSRELSLDEVAEIRQQCPDMELEVFVHGALCIAYSGRCLLSGYFNHRDPNQGTCTNSCRWDYKVHDAEDEIAGVIGPQEFNFRAEMEQSDLSNCGSMPRHPAADGVYLIEESQRPGELMPIMEDEHGTYIMNSKDLRAIEHVEQLVQIGIDSLKIEGRTKSALLRRTHLPGLPQGHRRRRCRHALRSCAVIGAGQPRQPRLHRRLLPAPSHRRAPELPARPFGVGTPAIRG